MSKKIDNLLCPPEASILDVYRIFNEAAALGLPVGIALVVDASGSLLGTITDGDIRKAITDRASLDLKAQQVMEPNPILFSIHDSLGDVVERLPNELAMRGRKSKKYLSKIVFVDSERRPQRVIEYHQIWEQRVASHRHVSVVGLGYVGLTLAATLAEAGFKVTGVDVDEFRLQELAAGRSYIHEVGLDELIREQFGKNLFVSGSIPIGSDVFIISVGTPVDRSTGEPLLQFIEKASEEIGAKLTQGALVILRSTIPIGTSRGVVVPILERVSGLRVGIDFHLSFAPERTAEGRALKELRSLPQVIGGYDRDSLEATVALFRDLTKTIIRVESLEAAEMVKLINNTFRDHIFGYANQMSKIAAKFNIDIEQVIHSANDGYPRDPVPLPSPGVGGPCLTKDPFIFAKVARDQALDPTLFMQSRATNESMHDHVLKQFEAGLERAGKKIEDCRVLLCGLAFKGEPETGDIRDSSSLAIARQLARKVKVLSVYDPVATAEEIALEGLTSAQLPGAFVGIDGVLFLNNHKSFEKIDTFSMVRSMAEYPVVFDGWRVFFKQDILATRPAVYVSLSLIETSLEVEN